jgi:flagellar motor switch protein FliN/FliY
MADEKETPKAPAEGTVATEPNTEEAAGPAAGAKPDPEASRKKKGLPPFSDLEQKVVNPASAPGNMNLLLDVPMKVAVQLGNTRMLIKELLQLGQGSVIQLDKIAGDPMDIYIGDKMIARGEIVVVNDMFGVRITDIISPVERIETFK